MGTHAEALRNRFPLHASGTKPASSGTEEVQKSNYFQTLLPKKNQGKVGQAMQAKDSQQRQPTHTSYADITKGQDILEDQARVEGWSTQFEEDRQEEVQETTPPSDDYTVEQETKTPLINRHLDNLQKKVENMEKTFHDKNK